MDRRNFLLAGGSICGLALTGCQPPPQAMQLYNYSGSPLLIRRFRSGRSWDEKLGRVGKTIIVNLGSGRVEIIRNDCVYGYELRFPVLESGGKPVHILPHGRRNLLKVKIGKDMAISLMQSEVSYVKDTYPDLGTQLMNYRERPSFELCAPPVA